MKCDLSSQSDKLKIFNKDIYKHLISDMWFVIYITKIRKGSIYENDIKDRLNKLTLILSMIIYKIVLLFHIFYLNTE